MTKKKNVCFFIYTQYLLTLWLKDLPAVVDVKLAHSLLHIYLKSPIWRSEVVLLFFKSFLYVATLQRVCVPHSSWKHWLDWNFYKGSLIFFASEVI